jgi:hypothetical protein
LECDIAGGPELIESMDGSAGNYLDFHLLIQVETWNKHGWQDLSTDGSNQGKVGPTKSPRSPLAVVEKPR